jgi:hypothetical protein
MKYFLAPRSGEKSYKNFLSTIKHGVPYERIAPFLSPEGREKVLQQEIIYAWGNREGTSRQWMLMEYGDTIIFYAKGKLVMAGEVYYKQHSPSLALAMWPRDEHGNPWEYTFFIKNLRYISIPMPVFNRLVDYKSNFIVQGFIHLTDPRVDAIVSQFGSVNSLLADFSDETSEEIPLTDEPVYVNLESDVEPELIVNPKILLPENFVPKEGTKKTPYKIDYAKRSRSNAITGSKGEVLVLNQEIDRLKKEGRKDLAKKVERVSLQDDSLGFDVLSYEQDGRDKPIEVKTSVGASNHIRFFLSDFEFKASSILKNYNLYYVDKIDKPRPRISMFADPFRGSKFKVAPDSYIVEGFRV